MLVRNKMIAIGLLVIALAGAYFALNGSGDEASQTQQPTIVKAMKAIKQDTPIILEYTGTIKGVQEIKVQSKVAGQVVEKYCQGGDTVYAGQPLFRIDSRQYESALLTAQANLSQARTAYNNAKSNLDRDEILLKEAAISYQAVENQRAATESNLATVNAMEGQLQLAQQNLADCIVCSPINGTLALDDVSIGTFVGSGNTPLVTVGSDDPVFVQVSLSENEYLKFTADGQRNQEDVKDINIQLILADGTEYPILGHVSQIDRAMGDNTGSLSAKVQFDNPNKLLVPGMFARIRSTGSIAKDAILVPQRAVQQLLSESFVMVVEDGKSKAVKVELAERIGSYYRVTKGLTGDEEIVVEGLTTLAEGMPLKVTNVTAADMGFSFTDSKTAVNQ